MVVNRGHGPDGGGQLGEMHRWLEPLLDAEPDMDVWDAAWFPIKVNGEIVGALVSDAVSNQSPQGDTGTVWPQRRLSRIPFSGLFAPRWKAL